MTNWKKTYSVWFNAITAVASALLAVALYLQTQDVPWAPLAIVCITAFTVFLRSLPQGPKPSDGGTPGSGSLNAILLPGLLACLLSGLTACALFRPAAPDFTSEEAKCLAGVDAREDIELVACGKDTSGGCSTDAIMDRYDTEAEACLKSY